MPSYANSILSSSNSDFSVLSGLSSVLNICPSKCSVLPIVLLVRFNAEIRFFFAAKFMIDSSIIPFNCVASDGGSLSCTSTLVSLLMTLEGNVKYDVNILDVAN